MSFGKMVELLQRKDKGKIILVNAGSFCKRTIKTRIETSSKIPYNKDMT